MNLRVASATSVAVGEYVRQLVVRGWTVMTYSDGSGAELVVAVCRLMTHFADVLIVRDGDHGGAYRGFLPDVAACPLRTDLVVWHYLGDSAGAARAISRIPPETLSVTPYAIPKACRVPDISPDEPHSGHVARPVGGWL